jgi:transposase
LTEPIAGDVPRLRHEPDIAQAREQVRRITDRALERLSPRFVALYVNFGRQSIPPEKLLRALLLQALYMIRSERQIMEQLDYNLLFRWFVGLGMDDPVWSPTMFTKNRDRLLEGDIAAPFFDAVLIHADNTERLLSDEHFTVDGTLLEARASHKSFRPRDPDPPAPGRGNPTVDSTGSAGGISRISRRPTRTRGCIRRRVAGKPASGTWAMWSWSTGRGPHPIRAQEAVAPYTWADHRRIGQIDARMTDAIEASGRPPGFWSSHMAGQLSRYTDTKVIGIEASRDGAT